VEQKVAAVCRIEKEIDKCRNCVTSGYYDTTTTAHRPGKPASFPSGQITDAMSLNGVV